jgi:hypothetical protein
MEKKKKQELFEASEDDVFNAEDLFAIQGGEDEDLDEDCYSMECVVAASFCINAKCVILS